MDKEKDKIITEAVNKLGEHFDVVVILASSHENGTTESWTRGYGNDFARAKMCEVYAGDFHDQRLASEISNSINGDS